MDIYKKLSEYQIILASQSPRRRYLLEGLGLDFAVQPVDVEECYPDSLKAQDIALYISKLKANAFPLENISGNPMVITADTIVWIDNQVLGKPKDVEDGVRILQQLSGRMHQVFTGVCIRTKSRERSFFACSDVYFKELSEDEIRWYLDKHKPYDKAGAYGAQEWIGYVAIRRIEGSYFNVMGLPTQMLWEELKALCAEKSLSESPK